MGGWMLGRSALAAARRLAAGDGDAAFLRNKLATARFYAEQMLPQAAAYAETVLAGAGALAEIDDSAL